MDISFGFNFCCTMGRATVTGLPALVRILAEGKTKGTQKSLSFARACIYRIGGAASIPSEQGSKCGICVRFTAFSSSLRKFVRLMLYVR